MTAVFGTFAVGWCDAVARTLHFEGRAATGAKDDPFDLLLHRVTTLRKYPAACVVQCRCDVQSKHPLVEDTLRRLARLLMPPVRHAAILEADQHDFFARSIAENAQGTMNQILDVPSELYGKKHVAEPIRVPAYAADAPDAMRALVRKLP